MRAFPVLLAAALLGSCAKFGTLDAPHPASDDASADDPPADEPEVPEPPPDLADAAPVSDRPCSARVKSVIWCDAFDTEANLKDDWPTRYVVRGTLEKTGLEPVSPPGMLAATAGGSETAFAYVMKGLSKLPKKVTMAFDLRLLEAPRKRFSVNRTKLGGLYVSLALGDDGSARLSTRTAESSPKYQTFDLPNVGLNRWRNVSITVDQTAAPVRLSVKLDGALVLDQAPVAAAVRADDNGAAMAGIFYVDPNVGTFRVHLDNFVLSDATN